MGCLDLCVQPKPLNTHVMIVMGIVVACEGLSKKAVVAGRTLHRNCNECHEEPPSVHPQPIIDYCKTLIHLVSTHEMKTSHSG